MSATTIICNAGSDLTSLRTRSNLNNLKSVNVDPEPGNNDPATTIKSKQFHRCKLFRLTKYLQGLKRSATTFNTISAPKVTKMIVSSTSKPLADAYVCAPTAAPATQITTIMKLLNKRDSMIRWLFIDKAIHKLVKLAFFPNQHVDNSKAYS